MPLRVAAALLCAILPGVVAWWTGRPLPGRRDDAALAELLLHRRSRLTRVAGVAFVALVVVARGVLLPAAVVLLVVALLAGSYPTRRALRGETWGLGRYLWHSLGGVVATGGFFILLAVAPQIVLGVPARAAPWAAAAVALLLLAWTRWAVPLWLRLHGATPIADHPQGAALAPRFAAIVAASRAGAPVAYRIGRPGERMVGAFALPSAGARPSAVALGDALLELLTPDEVAAVFAHEVAHLEHHTPARVRRGRVAAAVLAVASATLPLAVRAAELPDAWLVSAVWPLVVLVAVAARAGRSRAHEIASDLRAAELCGDPEALIRALVTLHTALLLPRRWPADAERAATHPSLANRIRALRGAATASAAATTVTGAAAGATGAAAGPSSLGAPVVLRSTRRGTFVVLDAARVSVLAGVPDGTVEADATALRDAAASVRAEAYERLVELRVAAEPGGGRVLVAAARGGGSWRVPLEPAAVAAAQAALDVVDVRLAPPPAARSARAARALAIVVPLLAMTAAGITGNSWIVLLAAFVALVRSGPATLALLGAVSLASALAALSWDAATATVVLPSREVALGVLALAVGGAVALALAWRDARDVAGDAGDAGHDRSGRGARVAVVGSALAAALLGAGAIAARFVAQSPAAALPALRDLMIVLAGLGAALTTLSGRRRRRLGGTLAAAAALSVVLLPIVVGDDETAGAAVPRPIALGTVTVRPAARVVLEAPARDLRLSPSGTRFAVRQIGDTTAFSGVASGGEDDESWDEVAGDDDAVRYETATRAAVARARAIAEARYVIGAFGDSGVGGATRRRQIAAFDLAFVDDDHVLALATHGGGGGADSLALTLEPAAADGGPPLWEMRLPALHGARLRSAMMPDGARAWTVAGRDRATHDLVALSGRVGAAPTEVTVRRWPAAAAGDGTHGGGGTVPAVRELYTAVPVAPTADGGAIAVGFDNRGGRIAATPWWPLVALVGGPGFAWRWDVWRFATDAAPARVLSVGGPPRCAAPHADPSAAAGGVACVSQDRDVALIWFVPADARGAALARPLGRVEGWYGYGQPVVGPDGGVALPAADGRSAVLVNARSGRGIRLVWPAESGAAAVRPEVARPSSPSFAYELDWTSGGLARLDSHARRSELTLYRVP